MQGGHVLVTGGTGFLGDELIRRLCTDTTTHLWVLSRASKDGSARDRILQRVAPEFHQRITIVEGDLGQRFLGLDTATDLSVTALYQRLVDSIDEVFHNAADLSFRNDPESRARIMDTNVGGTTRLLELVRRFRRPLKAFNFTSTAYVHGTWAPDRIFRENDRPTAWRNTYEQSKWESEELVANSGFPFRIFRPSIIVTEPEAAVLSHDGMYAIGAALAKGRDMYRRRFPNAHMSLEIIAAPDSAQNFVLRRDVVDMMMRLRNAPASMNGRFHAVTPSNTRLEHMFDAMAHVLGFSYAFVDQVKNGNPVSHLFRKTVLPAYEQYLFSECPRLDQSNVSAILGNDYVTGVVTAIDPAWMKALFTDYFIRQGVTESQPAVHETAAPATEPVERVEDVAALVEGWDNAVRVRLIGEYRMADRRTRLWRVRTPA